MYRHIKMPSRYYRYTLRNSDLKLLVSPKPQQLVTYISPFAAADPKINIFTQETYQEYNTLIYSVNNTESIIKFYDNAYNGILTAMDMIIEKREIADIIQYTYSLQQYINGEIEKLRKVPNLDEDLDDLEGIKSIIVGILNDIINNTSLPLVKMRIRYLVNSINQYKSGMTK